MLAIEPALTRARSSSTLSTVPSMPAGFSSKLGVELLAEAMLAKLRL